MGVSETVVRVGGSKEVGGCRHRGSDHTCGGGDSMTSSRESGQGGCGGGMHGSLGTS